MPDLNLPKENDAQLVVRLPTALKRRLTRLARAQRGKGAVSQVARIAIERGLDAIEKEAA